jgi:membrane-associated phospholipid phosphatase
MQLVHGSLRRPAVALMAACVAVIAATGVRVSGYGLPGWLDATFDPRFQALQGRVPVLLDWLPSLGELKPVTVMTFTLILACAVRLLLALSAVLLAAAVAAAMVAIDAHTFSDAVGGAAVGAVVVLACALTLDALGSLRLREPAAPPPPAG